MIRDFNRYELYRNTVPYDAFNPDAGAYVWDKIKKKNYYDKGIESSGWMNRNQNLQFMIMISSGIMKDHISNGNYYPVEYAKTFYEGMEGEGQKNIVNLLRCAWAGSQRFGALVWSGDIYSSFESMKCQVTAGLNMGLSGIPWWTTDIGGFYGAYGDDPEFRELFARWFAYGTFCPVMRLHGFRLPKMPQIGTTGGAECLSGSDNEVWSFGEEIYEICKKYMAIREHLKPYIRNLMKAAHEKGTPVIRPLFYDFPEDPKCWEVEESYMFGPDMTVAPVTEAKTVRKNVYLPVGCRWENAWTGEIYDGGNMVTVDTPLDRIPVFLREGTPNYLKEEE